MSERLDLIDVLTALSNEQASLIKLRRSINKVLILTRDNAKVFSSVSAIAHLIDARLDACNRERDAVINTIIKDHANGKL